MIARSPRAALSLAMAASLITAVLMSLLVTHRVAAQTVFEVEAAGGYTVVDVESVADLDGQIAQDWSQPAFRVAGRALFSSDTNRRFGVEAAYQHLYWYQVRVPFGSQPLTYDYNVSVTKVLGLFRYAAESGTALEVGAGFAIGDATALASSVAVGFPVSPSFAIKVRADAVLYDQPAVPVSVGVSYRFRSSSR
ncbi:MAG: hypothetical protein AAF389_15475 [Gemmatimonadota bacterium]